MITLFVTGLEFYAYHGVPAEERVIGHRYVVDIEFKVDSNAEETDDIADSVDYAAVAESIQSAMEELQVKTLEHLAKHCAIRLIKDFPKIAELCLRIAKRLPPAPIIADEVGVELTMTRDEIAS